MNGSLDVTDGFLVICSPAIGSFVGAATDRLQHGESIIWSRSKCASCRTVLRVRDLVPLVSYWSLGGRCRFCATRIPGDLFAIEILAFVITIVTMAVVLPDLRVIGTLFAWTLLALSWFDYRYGRLPDILTVPLGAVGVATAVINDALTDHVLGMAVGFAFPALLALSYQWVRGRDGLGLGDVKLFSALGAWVGWQGFALVMLFAASGSLLLCALQGHLASNHAIRFGPFIAMAGFAVWALAPYGGWP